MILFDGGNFLEFGTNLWREERKDHIIVLLTKGYTTLETYSM